MQEWRTPVFRDLCRAKELVMSGIRWSGNRLIQRVRGQEEELGYLELEPESTTCVLWLKDTFGGRDHRWRSHPG